MISIVSLRSFCGSSIQIASIALSCQYSSFSQGSPLNDFLTSHLTYSMLQSIPLCRQNNQYGRSRYTIYGVGSRISLYCIRPRMVRLRMRVVLLPVVALRLTPVLVLVTIMLFSFRTEPLQIRMHHLLVTRVR
jgi:hypothetical protein